MRFRFALPTTLAVTTIVSASACNVTSPSESSDESAESGTIPDYCIDIEDMTVCDSEPGCAWDQTGEYCENICYMITNEAECTAIEKCAWYPNGNEGETGAEAVCGEPFT